LFIIDNEEHRSSEYITGGNSIKKVTQKCHKEKRKTLEKRVEYPDIRIVRKLN
jgi:hypothetical protein